MKPELKSKIPNVVMNLTDEWIEKTKDAIAFTDEKGKRLIATATHNGLQGRLEEGEAVAELIHEAFTVFSRTNKTPGELEERIQKLESAVRKISNASNAQVDEYMVSAQLEECGTIADEALHP